jgi:hypothetical protein
MVSKICPQCGIVIFWNSYFNAWMCNRLSCNYFSREGKPEEHMTEMELHIRKYHRGEEA